MKKVFNTIVPVLLGILMCASNFLNTQLFNFGENNFVVWFVLSILCFACGWYINKSLGWHTGGKVVFATIIAATLVSMFVITFFRDYFSAEQPLTENLILYTLRNIMLGTMGFFGMAITETFTLQKEASVFHEKMKIMETLGLDARKHAELELREAKIEAKKIINDAEASAKNIILKKERIERELKEFIQAEKELIKKYENAG